MDGNEGDEKDDVKRKSRNLSEKKRRDQFNLLINELSGMVAANDRKMDKSTVLKATIAFLKNQKEVKSENEAIKDDFQSSFLSNEEFTHLMLEALDGFIMTVSCSGHILYTSDSITPLLGYLPNELNGLSLYDLMPLEDHDEMLQFLKNQKDFPADLSSFPRENKSDIRSIAIYVQRKSAPVSSASPEYERINITGYFESNKYPNEGTQFDSSCSGTDDTISVEEKQTSSFEHADTHFNKTIFIAICRLVQPQLLREMVIFEPVKSEFVSRHSLEWKFLSLDHRAPIIIGYLPFEVLGTSGYDYYHVDDLEKIAECHEILMKKGKGTSCFYRFLTKGQQWIWLQSQYYITYHQWNSKPEFIVCTNTVVSYDRLKGITSVAEDGVAEDATDAQIISGSEGGSKASFSMLSTTKKTNIKSEDILDNSGSGFTDKQRRDQRQPYSFRKGQSPNVSYITNRKDLQSTKDDQFNPNKVKSADLESVRSTLNSCSSSASSQYSMQTSYSMPHFQHLSSSGELTSWTKRTKSASQYSIGGVASESSSRESSSRKKRLQYLQRRQYSRAHHYSHSQIQQQNPPAIIADDMDSLHSSTASEMSVNSLASRTCKSSLTKGNLRDAYGTLKWKTNDLTFGSEVKDSLESSRLQCSAKAYPKEEPVLQFMVQSNNSNSTPNIDMRSVSATCNGLLFPSSGSGLRHQSLLQQQQFQEQQQFACNSNSNQSYCGVDSSFMGDHSQGQMVQVAAVPFSSMIPIQPVVTNHIVQIANSEGVCHSLALSPEQQQLQEQLRRKHSELQQLIMRQQEELRHVNQQLVMAQYDINNHLNKGGVPFGTPPSVGLTSSLTYKPSLNPEGTISTSIGNSCGSTFQNNIPIQTSVTMDTSSMSYLQNQNFASQTSSMERSHVPITSCIVGTSTHAMAVPYHLPQNQIQMLFAQPQANNSSLILQPEPLIQTSDMN